MTDLEKIQEHLDKAEKHLTVYTGEKSQLAYDSVHFANNLVKNLILHGVDMNPLRFENEILIKLKYNIMLQKLSKYLINKQWFISFVRLSLPDENEINELRNQYPASGGDAGWIQDAYKKGYIDGWNKKRTDSHLRKPTYKAKPKCNEA